jgi:hypothetical protein
MNVYDNPGSFGLEIIGLAEWRTEPYEFDLTAVFRDKSGALYWADSSGCSCPEPFEEYATLEDLDSGTAQELQAHLEQRLPGSKPEKNWNDPYASVAEIMLKVTS